MSTSQAPTPIVSSPTPSLSPARQPTASTTTSAAHSASPATNPSSSISTPSITSAATPTPAPEDTTNHPSSSASTAAAATSTPGASASGSLPLHQQSTSSASSTSGPPGASPTHPIPAPSTTSTAPSSVSGAHSNSSNSSTSQASTSQASMAVSAFPASPPYIVPIGPGLDAPTASGPSSSYAGLKTISPVAAATLSPADAHATSGPLLGGMSPEEAQRFSLGHLQSIGPGTSYSSPPQAFRPPVNTSQSFQPRYASATPAPAVRPSDVTSTPTASSAPPSTAKPAPVVAGAGTQPPNITITPEPGSGSSNNAAGDTLRAIPTNKNNPAFLNKLRSMVDDPNTDELIRWSPDGASFFVPNHVRFGDEVLPRFFKHNRFSSFVRQLNMYGFHKVPHLQQGALKHDSPQESELWEFSNPHFHRDHPEWLSKVQRKKGIRDEKDQRGDREGSTTGQELMHAGALMRTDFSAASAEGSGEGALQLASVLSAINAIKNAQSSITTDLRHLQSSNQNLWQEAMESRQRAKRQQETINKILRFLAGVFGNQEDSDAPVAGKKVSGKGRGTGRRVGVRPQQRKGRLMIEDGKSNSNNGGSSRSASDAFRGLEDLAIPAEDEDIEEMPSHLRFQETNTGDSPKGNSPPGGNGGSRFTTIGSPPKSTFDFANLASEAISTPGGSRRLSSQASNQVLNALASGEGNAWLASLFGASLANQGSKSTGPASGGGLKLDPNMVAALQQALAGASGSDSSDYFGNTNMNATANSNEDLSNRLSYLAGNGDIGNSSNGHSGVAAKGAASSSASSGPNLGNGLGLDADALARLAGISQALVQSPARGQAFNSATGLDNSVGSPSKAFGPSSDFLSGNSDNGNNQQLALSLARASTDLQNTTSNANQVQNSINALIEGLQMNPNFLQAVSNQQQQPPSASSSSAESSATPAWQSSQPSNIYPSQPAPFGGAGALINEMNSSHNSSGGNNPTNPSPGPGANANSGSNLGASAMDSDFDVDSFLSQFVDASQAPGGGVSSPGVFNADGAGGMGESPSFAFSPATTAAFLHGGHDANGNPSSMNAQPNGSGLLGMDTDSSNGSGASSSNNSPPSMWNMTGSQGKPSKKRKPSSTGTTPNSSSTAVEDVEMASRPQKKAVKGKS